MLRQEVTAARACAPGRQTTIRVPTSSRLITLK